MEVPYIFSPAKCPFCSQPFYLDSGRRKAYCIYCGQELDTLSVIQNYDPDTDGFLLYTQSSEQERELLHAEQLLELLQTHNSGQDYSEVIRCYREISTKYPRCSIAWWQQFRLVCCQNFDVNRYIKLHTYQIINHSFPDELNYLPEHCFYKFAFSYATDMEKRHYLQEFQQFYQSCIDYYEQRNLLHFVQKDDWSFLKGCWLSESDDRKINPSYLEFWYSDSCIYLIAGKKNGKNLSFARLSYRQPDEHCKFPYFKIISGQEDFPWKEQIPLHPLSSINRPQFNNITYRRADEDFEISNFRLKFLRFLVYFGILFH